jgi:hypothetical protein
MALGPRGVIRIFKIAAHFETDRQFLETRGTGRIIPSSNRATPHQPARIEVAQRAAEVAVYRLRAGTLIHTFFRGYRASKTAPSRQAGRCDYYVIAGIEIGDKYRVGKRPISI